MGMGVWDQECLITRRGRIAVNSGSVSVSKISLASHFPWSLPARRECVGMQAAIISFT